MKGKIILFIGLLLVILLIASCAKKNAVGPDNTNLPEVNLPTSFGHQVLPESTGTTEPANTVRQTDISLPFKFDHPIAIDTIAEIRENQPQAVNSMAWWWYVNQAIWNRAQQDIGKNLGMQCKPWASGVVQYATGFALPSTQSNGFYLNAGHSFKIVDGNVIGGGTIESGIGIGNIIQMYISSGSYIGPHTAIFYAYVQGGMYWVDCNFVAPGKVSIHFVSWDWFHSRVGTRYSIYQAQNY